MAAREWGRETQTHYWNRQIKYISKIPTVSQQVWSRRESLCLCPRDAGLKALSAGLQSNSLNNNLYILWKTWRKELDYKNSLLHSEPKVQ